MIARNRSQTKAIDMALRDRWETYYHQGAKRCLCPPHSLNIEPTNACNLRCTHCSLDPDRKRGFMELDRFVELVDQAASIGVEEIRLFLAGEPFLHKQIGQMIRACTDRGLLSIIHTNAAKMKPEHSREAIEAGLSVISISIDGATKQEYEASRCGAEFETTLENTVALLEQKRELGADGLQVIVQTLRPVGQPLSPPRVLRERFAGLPVNHFKVLHPHNWRGEAQVEQTRHETITPNPCMFLWHELSVRWDAKVVGCCADLNGFFIRGDLNSESIIEVWNNEKALELRRVHALGSPDDHPLCKGCSVPYQHQKVTPLSKVRKQEAKRRVKTLLGWFSGR